MTFKFVTMFQLRASRLYKVALNYSNLRVYRFDVCTVSELTCSFLALNFLKIRLHNPILKMGLKLISDILRPVVE